MKKLLLIVAAIFAISFTSCLPIETDDNYLLVNSEWSTKDLSQGLKFFDNGKVLFFWTHANGTGTYSYNADSQYIIFSNFTIASQGVISEFTSAEVLGDDTMKLYWHDVGDPKNYYMMLYKIR